MTYPASTRDEICKLIMQGKSLRAISAEEGMPDTTTIIDWLSKEPEFSLQYARAKEIQMELMAEELLEIADDGTNDWMEKKDAEGECIGWRENGEAVQRSRLRVDSRKWLMSKLAPKKYGDNQKIDLNVNKLSELSDEQLDNIITQATERLSKNG